MVKLKVTEAGYLGHTPDDVMSWADYYENIQKKVRNNEELEWHELDSVVILLSRTVATMRKKPYKFLAKKKAGKPTQNTKPFLKAELEKYAYLKLAKNLSEARYKIALNYLNYEFPSNSLDTFEERLAKKIQTIETQTRSFNFELIGGKKK